MSSNSVNGLLLLPTGTTISEGKLVTKIELAAIRPAHPSVPNVLKDRLLRSKAIDEFIRDGISTNHIKEHDGKLIFKTQRAFSPFLGYMMEAYVVRLFNDLPETIGHAAKIWAANLFDPPSATIKYKAVGTGFHTTKYEFPGQHSATDPMDLKFVRKRDEDAFDAFLVDHLLVSESTQHAGIQVKAITGNEKTEIILPLKTGRYLNVLTCLHHADGRHSFEVCMQELLNMRGKGEITEFDYHRIKNCIRAPSQLGIDQVDIDYYCKIAWNLHSQMKSEGVEVSRLDYESKDVATIEVANFTRRNGILVPDNLEDATDEGINNQSRIQLL